MLDFAATCAMTATNAQNFSLEMVLSTWYVSMKPKGKKFQGLKLIFLPFGTKKKQKQLEVENDPR